MVVEHADDLTGLVVDDRLVLLVVEGGHGEAPVVVRVHGEVDLAEVGEFWVEGVGRDFFARDVVGFGGEAPAWGCQGIILVVAAHDFDVPFSSISQCTLVKGIMSSRPFSCLTIKARWAVYPTLVQGLCKYHRTTLTPWTSIADVKMVATLLRRELGAGLL